MLWLVRQKYDFYLYLQKESAIFARMEEDEKFMRMALSEAESACEAGEVPIGCVVVSRGRIISRGHNLTETLHDVTAHAEMQAITAAANSLGGKYLQGCTLYVTVEPCVMCAGAIVQARIPRVVIGAMNAKAGCAGSVVNLLENPDFNHQCDITKGVLEDECSRLLSDFFSDLRRQKKQAD